MHIDWSTLALQTINVLVLVWLLARFLFRPVKTIIAERRAAAEKLLADAAATRAQAEADAAEVRQRLQSASADAERMMADGAHPGRSGAGQIAATGPRCGSPHAG